ncbi:hypothetical protein KAS08_05920 [Candidatus Pacearchaeota archaeon]|nr:hypothetical protein [Candidatus Pacearchaeota archaeon]
MEGIDLTKYQEDEKEKEKIRKIMGKVLSGHDGYEALEEKKTEKQRKCECGWPIEAGQKFCSECGTRV